MWPYVSRIVQSVFTNVPNIYDDFNATLLNTAAGTIDDIISSGLTSSQTFVFAALKANESDTSSEGGTNLGNSTSNSNTVDKKNTDLSLYV